MIETYYYYSACIGIKTEDVSILCDPWFTDGIYDGAWYQYPKLENPVEAIGEYDLIYISHIHPDHYDPVFLKEYLSKYPKTRIIIGDWNKNFLQKKMFEDGLGPYFLTDWRLYTAKDRAMGYSRGNTLISIVLNMSNPLDVDSALVVQEEDCVINMNDNTYNPDQVDRINKIISKPISKLFLSYAGAGPYPQCFYTDPEVLKEKAEWKKQEFFNRYLMMAKAFNAKVNVPFAGLYYLGGKLATLNPYRGIPNVREVAQIDPKAEIYDAPVPPADMFADKAMPYDSDVVPENVNMQDLIFDCVKKARKRFQTKDIHIVEINGYTGFFTRPIPEEFEWKTWTKITVDPKYLYGLLTKKYHWNNAEVGSQYMVTRTPDIYDPEVPQFLYFLHA